MDRGHDKGKRGKWLVGGEESPEGTCTCVCGEGGDLLDLWNGRIYADYPTCKLEYSHSMPRSPLAWASPFRALSTYDQSLFVPGPPTSAIVLPQRGDAPSPITLPCLIQQAPRPIWPLEGHLSLPRACQHSTSDGSKSLASPYWALPTLGPWSHARPTALNGSAPALGFVVHTASSHARIDSRLPTR